MNQLKDFILNNKFTSIAQNFLQKQSWEALRDNEITIGYEELIQFINESPENKEIKVNNIQFLEDKTVCLVATHQNKEQISLDLKIHEFKLLPKEAQITFSPKTNNINALPESGFINHIKMFFVKIFAVNFNDTILDKLFKEKTIGDCMYSNIIDGKIRIDFWDAIKETDLGKSFFGFYAFDFLQITDIKPNEKGFGIKVNIQIPEWLKSLLFIALTTVMHKMFNVIFKTRK